MQAASWTAPQRNDSTCHLHRLRIALALKREGFAMPESREARQAAAPRTRRYWRCKQCVCAQRIWHSRAAAAALARERLGVAATSRGALLVLLPLELQHLGRKGVAAADWRRWQCLGLCLLAKPRRSPAPQRATSKSDQLADRDERCAFCVAGERATNTAARAL